jgi:hypothetical protein
MLTPTKLFSHTIPNLYHAEGLRRRLRDESTAAMG